MAKTTLHLTVIGRVQGVGFRYYAQHAAAALGITGYVKNTYNGDVEIYAEGDKNKLAIFLQQIYKGPSLSKVINVTQEWGTVENVRYRSFVITY